MLFVFFHGFPFLDEVSYKRMKIKPKSGHAQQFSLYCTKHCIYLYNVMATIFSRLAFSFQLKQTIVNSGRCLIIVHFIFLFTNVCFTPESYLFIQRFRTEDKTRMKLTSKFCVLKLTNRKISLYLKISYPISTLYY